MRVLILGGTTEASALARRLVVVAGIDAILSLAGRTENPAAAPIACRVGGFGGPEGLAKYLRQEAIAAVVDATHPFAVCISANAAQACRAARVPLIAFTRPPWRAAAEDRWTLVPDIEAAAQALGSVPRRVFLTVGRLSLRAFAAAPQHAFVVRTIDPPSTIAALPVVRLILARGPFSVEDEQALIERERIEVMVTKNSGGAATFAKIEAARRLDLPVVMVERPKPPDINALTDLTAVVAWIEAHRPAP